MYLNNIKNTHKAQQAEDSIKKNKKNKKRNTKTNSNANSPRGLRHFCVACFQFVFLALFLGSRVERNTMGSSSQFE